MCDSGLMFAGYDERHVGLGGVNGLSDRCSSEGVATAGIVPSSCASKQEAGCCTADVVLKP